jgi:hypothetical protein
MQPEPIDTSSPITTPSNASEHINASQYGIRPDELHSAGTRDSLHLDRLSAESSHTPNAIQAPSIGDSVLQEELRRLSSGDRNDPRPNPSFQRISEYENALSPSPPRQRNEGPGFKIIKRKSNGINGPQLDAFPNGMCHLLLRHMLCD